MNLLRVIIGEFPTRQLQLFFASVCVVFIGFVCSRAMVSIGMIGLLLSGLYGADVSVLKKRIKEQPEFLLLTLLFWIVLLSGFYSTDTHAWGNFVRLHVPYLLVPAALLLLPVFGKGQLKWILGTFVVVLCSSAAVVLVNYTVHYDEVNILMKQGISIPSPFNHIRYSLMLVFAFWAAVYLCMQTVEANKKYLWALSAIFLFLMVHLLAVRSGLFAMYTCIAVAAMALIIVKRMFMYGLIVIGAMLLLPLLAYKFVPSVQTRLGYMLYDLQNYKDKKAIDASDGMRLRSWEVATEVAKRNMILGVGYGDMQAEMNEYYESHFPELQPAQKKLPHNQWLWVWLGSGIVGLILFGLATLYPWFKYRASVNWLWHFFFVIIIGSFMWEATLEEQMGTGFFIVWLCIFLNAETILPRHEA